MASVRRMHRRTLTTQYYFFCLPCFFGTWARSLAATVLSFLLDFGLPRIFPASDAGFLPVGIGHHLLSQLGCWRSSRAQGDGHEDRSECVRRSELPEFRIDQLVAAGDQSEASQRKQ